MVKSKFDEEGRPPHWQEGASQQALSGAPSSIFVVDQQSYLKMSPMEIQDVHRHRHILVTGADSGRLTQFDEDGLQMLADIDAEVSVQRMSFPINFTSIYLTQRAVQIQTRRH